MRYVSRFAIALASVIIAAGASAKPFTTADVPAALKPWLPWVMHDIKPETCPFFYDRVSQRNCIWPTKLSLALNGKSGSFSYTVSVYDAPDQKPQFIKLPGNEEVWPQDVKVNSKPAEVLLHDSGPYILLTQGSYTVTGEYHWDSMPVSVTIPAAVGLVHLTVNDREVTIPDIQGEQLWIQRETADSETAQENHLEAKLFRKVSDDIPLTIETAIRLQVAGKQREEELGKILPEGFVPVNITSDLPARLENDGMLHVQLRPGTWQLNILARAPGATASLKLPVRNGILPEQEIWSFEPHSQLRLVQVEGVDAIDPSQADLPEEWRSLPTYLVKPASHFTLTEKKRGVSEALPDQLGLSREIWLDFSGNGFTFKDSIYGTIHKSSRLEVTDGVVLGDASINGKSQYITTIYDDGKKSAPGIEVREGAINLSAGSRIESGSPRFSATGWNSSFDRMDAHLYLPPGWKLFSYSGADSATQSWVGQWTLLDIFLVLLAVVAIYKLYDIRTAAVALVGLVLMQHELLNFVQFVLALLATTAILRYIPEGKFRLLVNGVQKLVMLALLCSVLPFMVQHLRQAIYPQLVPTTANYANEQTLGGYAGGGAATDAAITTNGNFRQEPSYALKASPVESMPAPPPPLPEALPQGMMEEKSIGRHAIAKTRHKMERVMSPVKKIMPLSSFAALSSAQENYQQYAPDTKVQTGFGNASWHNNVIYFGWNGAVDPSVKLSLCLLSAKENLALAFIRVLLLAWLLALLSGVPMGRIKNTILAKGGTIALLLLLALPLLSPHGVYAQTSSANPAALPSGPLSTDLVFPPESLLADLQGKLEESVKEPPVCAPVCATVARTHIQVADSTLILMQEVHASDNIALPLPGGVSNWRAATVLVDNTPATGLVQGAEGYVYVNLKSGIHHVLMTGSLPANRDTVGISLPVTSHYTTVDAKGWDVQGVRENGLADNAVQLIRTQKHTAEAAEKTFEKTVIQPFFQLERTYTLGQQWKVSTIVRRITPADEPAAVNIPLLKGETITTAGIEVKNGAAYANFAGGSDEVSWQSVIAPGPSLKLVAAKDKPWVEVWRMTASNLWHVKWSGIPRVYLADPQTPGIINNQGNAASFWQWQPWPGETLDVEVTRPEGVEGATRTIDDSSLDVTPGERSMEMALHLHIRSSLGGQHELKLPEGAILLKVQQGGTVLPIQMKQNSLSLPLIPGDNQFDINWKQDETLPLAFTTPLVTHGLTRSVNAVTNVTMPQNRWILFTCGPQMGPAVLFWSWIPVILIIAFGLSKLAITPLRMWQWFVLLFGLSQADLASTAVIIAWLLFLGWRGRLAKYEMANWRFNAVQIALVVITLFSLSLLFTNISTGLLGSPDMRITGGDSYGNMLHWYQDITAATLPQVMVISVSLWVYRILMLLWALWLALSLVAWLRWGWKNFSDSGFWRKMTIKRA